MRQLALILLLFILIEFRVGANFCGPAMPKCIKKGIRNGVTSYCLRKTEKDKCTGRFWEDRRYCQNPNQAACGCCVPDSGTTVRASFKLINTVYNDSLTNPDSPDYQALDTKVRNEVLAKIGNKVIDFRIQFFRNGSALSPTGTSDSVIVDALVLTKDTTQHAADRYVRRVLRNSGVPDLVPSSVSVGTRLCVAGYQASDACASMKAEKPWLKFICVQARDKSQCLQWVDSTEADVVRADPEDIYLANTKFGNRLSVVAKTVDKDKEDELCQDCIVSVVRRNTFKGLEGSKPCFTDYDKTDGWFGPISKLMEQHKWNCSHNGSVVEKNLYAASLLFGEACLPGKWAPDSVTNERLKQKYSNLCDLCDDPDKCSAKDDYAGYNGVLKCITNNEDADVTWTKLAEVISHTPSLSNAEFGFLCPDGSIINLNSNDPCCWARKSWPGWLIRANDNDTDVIVSAVEKVTQVAQYRPDQWAKPLLGTANKSITIEIVPRPSPIEYLNQCGYYQTLSNAGCPGKNVGWCVIDKNELNKCNELKQVLQSRRVRPLIDCIETDGSDDCITTIVLGNSDADFVSLDGGDVFSGYREKKTIPVISELYGNHAASYYAVAVVRATTTINNLKDLKGKDSCHTGIDKTSGWNMPLINLIDAGLINKTACEYPIQIGNFFHESCAPGAKSLKYDKNGTNPDSLCELCIGNGLPGNAYKCDRDSNELYYGYTGAFRCLVEASGNVAFVKHTTVLSNTGDKCVHPWCDNKTASDYLLLCPEGGLQPVENYENCTLGEVPSHMVVTGYDASDALKDNIRILLLTASEILPPGNDVFVLFGDYGPYHDALFKNSATGLINLSQEDFDKLKNGYYWNALTAIADCQD